MPVGTTTSNKNLRLKTVGKLAEKLAGLFVIDSSLPENIFCSFITFLYFYCYLAIRNLFSMIKILSRILHFKRLFIILFVLHFSFSCKENETKNKFTLDGIFSLTFHNRSTDSIHFKVRNEYLIPLTSQEIDSVIVPNGKISLRLVSQANNYLDLLINEKEFKMFSRPGANDEVTIIDKNPGFEVLFSGDCREINDFLRRKAERYNTALIDILPRVNATNSAKLFNEVVQINDQVTEDQIKFLNENQNELPGWYVEFENIRLQYLNAFFKFNSLSYRKSLLQKNDIVSNMFFETTLGLLPIQNEKMIGNITYFLFLNEIIYYQSNLQNSNLPTNAVQWKIRFKHLLETGENILSGRVREVYLAYELSNLISNKFEAFDPKWINNLGDPNLKAILENQIANQYTLTNGEKMPYFYLGDSAANIFQPNSFKNKILLINFWATWCKPCLKEFPAENYLKTKFANEPVEIINICIESDSLKWRAIISRNNLKTLNLFANDNWSKKLAKNYFINGLPHSVLIDWNGRIVQNKCARPSEDVEARIYDLLKKRKAFKE